MMTILASYAQEESRSASENQRWRIKRNFEQGIPWNGTLLGYRIEDALVKENAAAPQSQKVYNAKYENLTKRYETASAELDRLRGLRAKREQQDKAMASFIRSLRKQPEVMNTWNDTIWTVMVEKAIVHRDSSITFKFYNGAEIHVGNEKVCW